MLWGSAGDLRNIHSLLGGGKRHPPTLLPADDLEKHPQPPLQICPERSPLLRECVCVCVWEQDILTCSSVGLLCHLTNM